MFEIQSFLVQRQSKFSCGCLLINLEEGKSAEILTVGMKSGILLIYLCCKNLQLRSNSCSRFLQLSGTVPSVYTGYLILQTWQFHSPHDSIIEKGTSSKVESFSILAGIISDFLVYFLAHFPHLAAFTHLLSKTVAQKIPQKLLEVYWAFAYKYSCWAFVGLKLKGQS